MTLVKQEAEWSLLLRCGDENFAGATDAWLVLVGEETVEEPVWVWGVEGSGSLTRPEDDEDTGEGCGGFLEAAQTAEVDEERFGDEVCGDEDGGI